jgi:hypothetical protein
MRHNQPTIDEKEAQAAISLDFKLEELIGPGQMFKLTLIPDLSSVPHPHKQSCELLLGCNRKLLEPVFCWYGAIWSNVKLNSEDPAVIDQSGQWRLT